jgi:hypothetical protein
VRKLDKTKFWQLEIYIAPFSNWKRVWITTLHFRPLHVATDPDENIENGLKVMAKFMGKIWAILQHNFQSHEGGSPLESLRLEDHFRWKQTHTVQKLWETCCSGAVLTVAA